MESHSKNAFTFLRNLLFHTTPTLDFGTLGYNNKSCDSLTVCNFIKLSFNTHTSHVNYWITRCKQVVSQLNLIIICYKVAYTSSYTQILWPVALMAYASVGTFIRKQTTLHRYIFMLLNATQDEWMQEALIGVRKDGLRNITILRINTSVKNLKNSIFCAWLLAFYFPRPANILEPRL